MEEPAMPSLREEIDYIFYKADNTEYGVSREECVEEVLQLIRQRLPQKAILDPINQDPINASTNYWVAKGHDIAISEMERSLE